MPISWPRLQATRASLRVAMSEPKRIANYRSGDRAETLGLVLMQTFCAVTPVPRPEDFGVFDAVATLLRREKRILFAEDSFLIQFKSRTVTSLEFFGDRFKALLDQELSLFIAQVDLKRAEISLYCVGGALTHSNVKDAIGAIFYLDESPQRNLQDGIIHLSLGEPALKWTTAELENQSFQETAYQVLKRWLEMDRWNRRFRPMGMQTGISWKTNEVPSVGMTSTSWNPSRAIDQLSEVVPSIQMVAFLALNEPALRKPILEICAWLRAKGIEPDQSGMQRLMLMLQSGKDHLSQVLASVVDADLAVHFQWISGTSNHCSFWEQAVNRSEQTSSEKREGTAEDLRKLGYVLGFDRETDQINEIGFQAAWLIERKLEFLSRHGSAFLFKFATEELPS
jgi:hypothetical protein